MILQLSSSNYAKLIPSLLRCPRRLP
jgi:hypothetical protein